MGKRDRRYFVQRADGAYLYRVNNDTSTVWVKDKMKAYTFEKKHIDNRSWLKVRYEIKLIEATYDEKHGRVI